MSQATISWKQLPGELERRERAVRRALGVGIRNGARRGRAVLVQRTPKDQGLMKAAWRDSAVPGATAGFVAEVMNDAPYAGIVESGARPHPVSEEGQLAIYEWVKRHFGVVRAGRGRYVAWAKGSPAPGRVRSRLSGKLAELNLAAELVPIAQAIIHRLRTEGQAPTYFIRNSREDLARYANEEVDRALRGVAGKAKAGA